MDAVTPHERLIGARLIAASAATAAGKITAQSARVAASRFRAFAKYAWAVVAYNLMVVAWGGYVRATSSGAGCGSHWPLCNGEMIPRAPRIETIIELTHRLTSGLALLFVVGLFLWSRKAYAPKHTVRRAAALSIFFMLTEALIGAGLVLFRLVAHDDSIARAVYLSVHLINTFLLLAALALTAWWASAGKALRLREQEKTFKVLAVGAIFATLVLGVSGAVTALGDTLFPSASLAAGFKQDLQPTAHFLIRLRVLHPLIAITVGALLVAFAVFSLRRCAKEGGNDGSGDIKIGSEWTRRFAIALMCFVAAQFVVGAFNVALLAPIPLQLVHLLLADSMWLALVLLIAAMLAGEPARQTKFSSVGV